jgi:hypothetical protein
VAVVVVAVVVVDKDDLEFRILPADTLDAVLQNLR